MNIYVYIYSTGYENDGSVLSFVLLRLLVK